MGLFGSMEPIWTRYENNLILGNKKTLWIPCRVSLSIIQIIIYFIIVWWT